MRSTAAWFLVLVWSGASAGCGDDEGSKDSSVETDPTEGGVPDAEARRPTDAGRAGLGAAGSDGSAGAAGRASSDEADSGAPSNTAGGGAGEAGADPDDAGASGSGGGTSAASCEMCRSQMHDGDTLCPDSVARCDGMEGTTSAASPVRPGTPRARLCREILDCMQTQHCAKERATDCLCGDGVNVNTCFGGNFEAMKGPCKELIAAGVESKNVTEIAERFSDEMYPVGAAVAVVELCDQLSCAKECL